MPRRKQRSRRSFHKQAMRFWDERLEERIAEEARKAEETLVTRRLERDAAIRKAAEEGGGEPLRLLELGAQELDVAEH